MMQDYINERMTEYAANINDYSIGQEVYDLDNCICIITSKTLNSIEVSIKKKTNEGVDCKQWFDMNKFNKRFKIK